MRYGWSLVLLLSSSSLLAQPVPRAHVPPSVLMEISVLERTFDAALGADCSLDRCMSKGCVYVQHQTVDVPRSSSLPGLPTEAGPGSVVPQEYLTEARCEFTYESSVDKKDVQALVRRLEQRLSRAWRKVSVVPQPLSPLSRELQEPLPSETPDATEDVDNPPPPLVEPVADDDEAWSSRAALRELWNELLPHFWWMVALFLSTIVAMALIWAARRLGKASLEERMMEAQLAARPPP
ncbi:MAG: hypothetical protein ACO3JL_04220, partial [Myxococcota bacterium]